MLHIQYARTKFRRGIIDKVSMLLRPPAGYIRRTFLIGPRELREGLTDAMNSSDELGNKELTRDESMHSSCKGAISL